MTLSRHLNIVFFNLGVVYCYMLHTPCYYHVILKQYFSRLYKLPIKLQMYQHLQITRMEHCYFSVNVCNNSIFLKSVELLINIFWRSNICTIANSTNRNKWFHTFIQNSLFYRLSHNAIQIWMLTGLCEELLLLDLL